MHINRGVEVEELQGGMVGAARSVVGQSTALSDRASYNRILRPSTGIIMKSMAKPWMTLWVLLLGVPSLAADSNKSSIIVFAAASLTDVMQELGDNFTKQTSIPVKFSFAASSVLARQIENGAPADIFFSADLEWMDYLEVRRLVQIPTRHNVLGNRLVLVAPASSKLELKIAANFPLSSVLGKGRLATGDPDSVPVGRYAREALTKLGVWNSVENHLAAADSVRSALAFVDRGEAPLGIVYETDALIDKKVRVVDVFPDDTHSLIIYPIALTTVAKTDAVKFLDYVRGPTGDAAFKKNGFIVLHK